MIRSAIRWLALIGVSGAVVWLVWQHEHGGAKGLAVPVPNVVSCVVVAAVAAVLCKRYWLAFAAPFVAGLAGVIAIAEPRCGPYGGLLGILVGIWILLLPVVFHFGKTADQATPIKRFRLQFGLKHLFACATLVAIGMPIHRAWGWLGVVDYVLLLLASAGLLACWRGRRRLGLAVVLAAAVLAATEVAITYAHRPMLWWLVWDWKTPAYLATLGSNDVIAHEHVAFLLNRHGIDWWGTSGGGTGYEVFCPQDSARAVGIVKADALTYGYEIRLRGGWRTPTESIPPTVKRDIRKPMAALLSMPEWADRTELGALLRCRRVQDDAAICPFVRSIAVQKRPYRGSNGDLQIGYCVELELVREGDDDSCLSRMGYLVWDGGRRIGFLGGARYGPGWPVSENGELCEGLR